MIESKLYYTNIPYQGGYMYETAQHRSMYPAEPGYLRNLRHLLDDRTERRNQRALRQAGYKVIGEPRTTGDGFYESVILDPDNNRIEISA